MLESLEILNGEISLEFDPLISAYSVNVESDVSSLDFSYVCSNECDVEITGNTFITSESDVVVLSVDNISKYTFYINKESTKSVMYEENVVEALEVEVVSVSNENYKVEYLIVICIVILLIAFKIIFKKKKHN